MRTLLAALTAIMLFATPVVAGDFEDGVAAYQAGDYQKAFRLYKLLAEQGSIAAQYNLGMMYDIGEGVSEDDSKAVYWWRKAAEQGFAWAQYNLRQKYLRGEGVPKNAAKAAHWYRKAAEQGFKEAQGVIGLWCAQGKGIPEDRAKGYAWSSIAAAQEDEHAKENKVIIKRVLTPAQIAKGQELAAKYWEKYVVPFQKD